MSRAPGVQRATVQDWRQDHTSPRPGVYMDLLRLAEERRAELDDLVDALKHHIAAR